MHLVITPQAQHSQPPSASPYPQNTQLLPPRRLATAPNNLNPPGPLQLANPPRHLLGPVLPTQQQVRAPPRRQDPRQHPNQPLRRLQAVPAPRVRQAQQVALVVPARLPAIVRKRLRPHGHLRRRHIRRVKHQHIHLVRPQRAREVPRPRAQVHAVRVGVGSRRREDGLHGGPAGKGIHVDAAGEQVAVAEERARVGVEKGDDDAGAGANLEDHRRGGRGREGRLEKGRFRRGRERVQEEEGVFGRFVHARVRHVGRIWRWKHLERRGVGGGGREGVNNERYRVLLALLKKKREI
ncbi:hypothetical protein MGU_03007 [Metarhizium guizhouense ARSEF 977]|uniref:Uncharacterized protein n=1 Tax=Metarhizium guizhouense (strain ARSEF 977) TaxID=1276136 RepID=A0A0B4HDP6_METGA|nr:hypothetical protein MGU_03007 [Metarhizium guizhouense ARSEF 977]